MPYGYDPAEYRSNFNFIAQAGQDVGSAIDKGVEDNKMEKYNQQLYGEAVQHAQALGETGKKIGFTPETIPKPAPGQKDYHNVMTNYAMKMYQAAAEQNLHQQVLDTSKNLATNAHLTETGNQPLVQGVTEAAQTGINKAQEPQGAQNAAPGLGGTVASRSAIMASPSAGPSAMQQTPAPTLKPYTPPQSIQDDLNKTPERTALDVVPPARPVSSVEYQDAANTLDVGNEQETKDAVDPREKRESLQSKEDNTDKTNSTRLAIAEKADKTRRDIAQKKGDLTKRGQDLQAKAKTKKDKEDLAKLLVEIGKAKVSAELDKKKIAANAMSDDQFDAVNAEQKKLKDLADKFDDVERRIDSNYNAASKDVEKKKPLTSDVVSQAKQKFGTDKVGAKKWLEDQGYDVK